MADLRLIPDKGLLEDLIAQAEALNEADYEGTELCGNAHGSCSGEGSVRR